MPLHERFVRRMTPLTSAAAALIALQAVVRGWVVSDSYYFQDDFAHLDLARSAGLTTEFLVRDYGGHVEVGQYFLMWLLSHAIDGSFAPAAFSVIVLQAATSLGLFQLLRTLFGDSRLILVPWTAYLFTPLALGFSSWWSAALQTLPMQLATVVVLLAVTRAHRQRSRRWALLSVLVFAAGLLMWQKAALILPLALAVHLLVTTHDLPWKERLVGLRRQWGMWSAHAGVLGAYIFFYLATVDEGTALTQAEPIRWGSLLTQTLFRMFVPGLFGGPWHARGAESTIYPYTETYAALIFLFVFACLVVLSFVVSGARAYAGWLLLVGYLTADLSLLALGRSDWIGLLLRDPRYVADALPVVTIAVLASCRGLLETGRSERAAAVWLRQRMTMAVVLRVVALLFVSSLITTVRMAPAVQHEYAANFTRGVADQMEAEPERSVLNSAPPYEISARADLEGMMNAVGAEVVFDRPAVEMFIFDGLAQLRLVDLFPGSDERTGPVKGCGWAVDQQEADLWSVESDDATPRVLRVGYYAGSEATLHVSVAGRSSSLDVPAGVGRAFFVVGPESGRVSARVEDGDGVCVTDLAVGAAWVAVQPDTTAQ